MKTIEQSRLEEARERHRAVDLPWGCAPTIALDMEFHHLNVSAYFRLVLRSLEAGIEISYVSFEGGADDPDRNTNRLIEAIEDARIAPRSRGRKRHEGDASQDGPSLSA